MGQLEIIKANFFVKGLNGRWGLPILLMGEPGVGKSRIIQKAAEECGLVSTALVAGQGDPADVCGYQIPDTKAGVVRQLPAPWAEQANRSGSALVLFDEITNYNKHVQDAIMRIILEGVAGDFTLDNRVRLMAAANPPEIATNGRNLAVALNNRFGHMNFSACGDADDWVDWLIRQQHKPTTQKSAAAMEKHVEDVWDAYYQQACVDIGTFIAGNPHKLHKMPNRDEMSVKTAWPSRRTWEMAARALAGARIHKLNEDDTVSYIGAFVGNGSAFEAMSSIANSDLPNIPSILDGDIEWHPKDSRRVDLVSAVLLGCIAILDGTEDKDAWVSRMGNYERLCASLTSDASSKGLVIASMTKLFENNGKFSVSITNGKADFVFTCEQLVEDLGKHVVKIYNF